MHFAATACQTLTGDAARRDYVAGHFTPRAILHALSQAVRKFAGRAYISILFLILSPSYPVPLSSSSHSAECVRSVSFTCGICRARTHTEI